MTTNILIAGFGGQGILFAGKFLIYAGLINGHEVSHLPSYGPEMRGGTANCSVIISDKPIGSPIVDSPDVLVVMNLPSLDKFEGSCVNGAKVFIDSALITNKVSRADLKAFYIPATRLADENGLTGLANMVMTGFVIQKTGVVPYDIIEQAMRKTIPERKKDLFASNIRAIDIGWNFD